MMDSIVWYLTAGAGTFYPTSQRTPEAASPPPRKQKHPISPQATTSVPPRSFAAFMKSRKPGETPTTPKSRAVR